MSKIQKISNLEPTIGFSEFDFYKNNQESFPYSDLGKLYHAIPFSSLAASLGLKDSGKGRSSYFSPEGKLALLIIKGYTRFSGSELIDNLNSNIHYQIFCDVRINPLNPLTNLKIVSAILCEIAWLLDIDKLQEILSSYCKSYILSSM